MIKVENLSPSILKIIVPKKLKSGDFKEITPLVNAIIAQHGSLKILVDASEFEGWENTAAFEEHAGFVKNHQQKVERAAVITGHEWQHWLIGVAKIFAHPQIAAFDKGDGKKAEEWLEKN